MEVLAAASGLVKHWLSQATYSLSALTADIRVRETSTLPSHTDGVMSHWRLPSFYIPFRKGCLFIFVHGIPSLFSFSFSFIINSDGKLKSTTRLTDKTFRARGVSIESNLFYYIWIKLFVHGLSAILILKRGQFKLIGFNS